LHFQISNKLGKEVTKRVLPVIRDPEGEPVQEEEGEDAEQQILSLFQSSGKKKLKLSEED
jgi:hypothetical protein